MGLFAIGIITGGMMMIVACILLQLRPLFLSPQVTSSTPTQDNRPRLIALEPTAVPRQVTKTPLPRIATARPSPSPTQPAVSLTPTAFPLQNVQPPEVIGYSMEGRPLEVYTFGSGERERMIVAGIHGGDEWNTITLVNQLIQYLDRNPDAIPGDVKLYILPNLNPDGEARAHDKYGRLNHNGVDLNRNFPTNWLADWDRSGCWNSLPTSSGTEPGSEAETQALMKFIGSQDLQALVSYHSAALGIFPGGWPWDEDATRLAESIAEVTSYRFPPLDTGCTYSGTLADHAVSLGIAAVDLELTNHFDTDFDENLNVLDVLLNFEP